jgi:hypothetical protein
LCKPYDSIAAEVAIAAFTVRLNSGLSLEYSQTFYKQLARFNITLNADHEELHMMLARSCSDGDDHVAAVLMEMIMLVAAAMEMIK